MLFPNLPLPALVIPALICAAHTVVRLYDASLSRFALLVICRYYRLVIGLFGQYRYKPPIVLHPTTFGPQDATIIITTISVSGNSAFKECLEKCLLNRPAKLVVVTDTKEREREVKAEYADIKQSLHAAPKIGQIPVEVVTAGVADKRVQMKHGIVASNSKILVFVDSQVFLGPHFLETVTAVFDNPRVGICGTQKRVRWRPTSGSLPRPLWHAYWDFSAFLIQQYWLAFWNFLGVAYLLRHNFILRGTYSMDGGVFVISGRAMAVRASLVNTDQFLRSFLHENTVSPSIRAVLEFSGIQVSEYARIGDDNFITNYITAQYFLTVFLDTEDATVETYLGEPSTFLHKCIRWRRTTYRYNIILLLRGHVWSLWPCTVWFLVGDLVNLSLFWDPAILFAFTKTDLYSPQTLIFLAICIYFSKAVKLIPHFKSHPSHFFLFFFPLPAYHVWAYFHSLLSVYSFFTCWNQTWEGGTHNK